MTLHKNLCKTAKMVQKKRNCITTGKNLKDQTLKREIKCGYYTKILKADDQTRN